MSGPTFIQKGVADFVSATHSLTPSLLLNKYAQIGKTTDRKGNTVPLRSEAVHAVCKAVALPPKQSPVWSQHPDARVFYMLLKSRMMINMAGGVIENGNFSLHPLTSQPLLPGSAIKGATRHAAWHSWNEAEDPNEKKVIAGAMADIFGFPSNDESGLDRYLTETLGFEKDTSLSGSIIFLNAHPLDKATLTEDILTPHTGSNPVPNLFPAIDAGATFVFALLPGRRFQQFDEETRNRYWDLVSTWLKEALTEEGIGAKTSAGYGWFEENTAIKDRLEKEREAQQAAKAMQKEETERLKALDPMERLVDAYLALSDEPFALAAKDVHAATPEEQHAFLLAVSDPSKKDWWKKKKKKAKKFPADQAVVDALMSLATTYKVGLL